EHLRARRPVKMDRIYFLAVIVTITCLAPAVAQSEKPPAMGSDKEAQISTLKTMFEAFQQDVIRFQSDLWNAADHRGDLKAENDVDKDYQTLKDSAIRICDQWNNVESSKYLLNNSDKVQIQLATVPLSACAKNLYTLLSRDRRLSSGPCRT